MDEVLAEVFRQNPLLDEAVNEVTRLWLEQVQVASGRRVFQVNKKRPGPVCLLYTSDAADE